MICSELLRRLVGCSTGTCLLFAAEEECNGSETAVVKQLVISRVDRIMLFIESLVYIYKVQR